MSAETATFDNLVGALSGGLRTIVGPMQTVVRLEGEIDLSMAAEFGEPLLTLPTVTAELVLDVKGLTFCDATLAGFIAGVLGHMPVTVIHPNRWVREFLALVNLADRVRIIEDAS
jgi:hypothetical protein